MSGPLTFASSPLVSPKGSPTRVPSFHNQATETSALVPSRGYFAACASGLSTCWSYSKIPVIFITALTGAAAYYFIGAAGCLILISKWSLKGDTWSNYFFTINISTCIYRLAGYLLMLIEYMPLPKQHKCLAAVLIALSMFSSTTYFIAGFDGAQEAKLAESSDFIIGFVNLALRMIGSIHGINKFTELYDDLKADVYSAVSEKKVGVILRLFINFFIAAGYSFYSTDSIDPSIDKMSSLLKFRSPELDIIAAILGAIGAFPTVFYWGDRGFKQLLYTPKFDADGNLKPLLDANGEVKKDANGNPKYPDLRDWYTAFAFIFCFVVIPGCIGSSVSESAEEEKVTGYLFSTPVAVRIGFASANTLFAITGVAKMARNSAPYISSAASGLWGCLRSGASLVCSAFSCCRKKTETQRDLEEAILPSTD